MLSPLALLGQQVLLIGPATAPVWIAGLWAFAARPKLPVYRAFVIAYITLLVLVVLLHGKAYYAGPIYPALLAGGAVWLEPRLRSLAVRAAAIIVITCFAVFLAPFAIPVLPVNTYLAYARFLGQSPSSSATEKLEIGALPQQFADMFGWPEMAAKVAAVYNELPPAHRARAVFFGRNYGEAAAIDVFGQPLGLPPAISGHNNYFLWGPRGHDASVVIALETTRQRSSRCIGRLPSQATYIDSPYAMSYQPTCRHCVLGGLKFPFGAEPQALRVIAKGGADAKDRGHAGRGHARHDCMTAIGCTATARRRE